MNVWLRKSYESRILVLYEGRKEGRMEGLGLEFLVSF
jgi:hypothetical protein